MQGSSGSTDYRSLLVCLFQLTTSSSSPVGVLEVGDTRIVGIFDSVSLTRNLDCLSSLTLSIKVVAAGLRFFVSGTDIVLRTMSIVDCS